MSRAYLQTDGIVLQAKVQRAGGGPYSSRACVSGTAVALTLTEFMLRACRQLYRDCLRLVKHVAGTSVRRSSS